MTIGVYRGPLETRAQFRERILADGADRGRESALRAHMTAGCVVARTADPLHPPRSRCADWCLCPCHDVIPGEAS